MAVSEDYGNLGNLISYLNGNNPIEERILKAEKIFFLPISVPPQHKEEVVISWLIDILCTDKALTFTQEELKTVWVTISKLLSSKRIKALCSHNWVCPLTSAFIQTLISISSDMTTPLDILEEVFTICQTLLVSPSLSPRISYLSNRSVALCSALLPWVYNKGNISSPVLSLLAIVLQKARCILNNRGDKLKVLITVFDKILYPSLELSIKLQKETSVKAKDVLEEIKKLIMLTLFTKDNLHVFVNILELPLQNESKQHLSRNGESFFAFLMKCIESSSVSIGTYILREFMACFFKSYKDTKSILPFQLVVNTMHIIGISLEAGPTVEENSLAALNLTPLYLDNATKERHIVSILQAIMIGNLDLNQICSYVSLKSWLENLTIYILNQDHLSKDSFRALNLMLIINPLSTIEIPNLLPTILLCEKTCDISYSAFDNLLCELLNISIKMRSVDNIFEKFSQSILNANKEEFIRNPPVIPDSMFYYEGKQMLPNRFMKRFLASINQMGAQMILKLWSCIHSLLSLKCKALLEGAREDPQSVLTVSLTVWLSSCCLSATSIMDIFSISGMATQIAELMNTFADECIAPLVSDMLEHHKENKPLCRSLLNLILVWSEIHINLLSTDTGYVEATHYPWKYSEFSSHSATDFSSQAKFITNGTWKQILANLDADFDDCSRFAVVQLLIQKVAIIELHMVENKARNIKAVDEKLTSIKRSCLKYIFEKEDVNKFPMTTDLIAYHLPSLISLLNQSHLNIVARLFVSGMEENREAWLRFGKSFQFQESQLLQSYVLTIVCQTLFNFLAGSKKKLDIEKLDLISMKDKAKPKYLSRMIVTKLIQLFKITKVKLNEPSKQLKSCFVLVNLLLNNKKKRLKLAKHDEKKIIWLLRILEMLPFSFLQPKCLMSVFALLASIMVEEGGLKGRSEIIFLIIKMFHQILDSSNCDWMFKVVKVKPYVFLMWLVREIEGILKVSSSEESQLDIILSKKVSLESEENPSVLAKLVCLLNSVTEAFVTWDKTGIKILKYTTIVVSSGRRSKKLEAYLQACLMIVTQLRRFQPLGETVNKMNPNLMHSLNMIGKWMFDVSESLELATVKPLTIAACLASFTSLLMVKAAKELPYPEKLHNKSKDHVEKMDCDDDPKNREIDTPISIPKSNGISDKSQENMDCEDAPVDETNKKPSIPKIRNSEEKKINGCTSQDSKGKIPAIDLKKMMLNGNRLVELCIDSDHNQLTVFSFNFLTMAAYLPKYTQIDNWILFQKAWKIVSAESESPNLNPMMTSLFSTMHLKHFKTLLEMLLKDIQKDALNLQCFSQWRIIIEVEPKTKVMLQTKTFALEQLVSILVLQATSVQIEGNEDKLTRLLRIFQTILKKQCVLSKYSKSLILNVCLNLQLKDVGVSSFLKLFKEISQIIILMLFNESYLVSNRAPTILTVLSQLALCFISLSSQKQNLASNVVKDLEIACLELEKIANGIKQYDIHVFKIAPYYIATIIEGMQQTTLHPQIKICMERIIYLLLDVSDSYSLKHLLVTLPPSVTTLLKHFYNNFNENYRYNPHKS